MSKPNLFTPLQIGDLQLPNRIVMAPLNRGRTDEAYKAKHIMATYYAQRASSGLIISEGAHVSLSARGWYQAPDIYMEQNVKDWLPITKAVHAANEDLVERFEQGKQLTEITDPSTLYSSVGNHPGPKGYTDYPNAT